MNYYEQRLHEITVMLHLNAVKKNKWMQEKLITERTEVLQTLKEY